MPLGVGRSQYVGLYQGAFVFHKHISSSLFVLVNILSNTVAIRSAIIFDSSSELVIIDRYIMCTFGYSLFSCNLFYKASQKYVEFLIHIIIIMLAGLQRILAFSNSLSICLSVCYQCLDLHLHKHFGIYLAIKLYGLHQFCVLKWPSVLYALILSSSLS